MTGEELEKKKAKFFSKAEKDPSGCWLWTGRLNHLGYGWFYISKHKKGGAHRCAYWLFKGEIEPRTLLVCHKCDVPKCVNPDHLFLGTDYDNAMDCVTKGRHYSVFKKRRRIIDGVWYCQKRNHPMVGENVTVQKDGRVNCRECHRIVNRVRNERRKAKQNLNRHAERASDGEKEK